MIAGGALRRDGMLMHMDAPRRRLRDLGFWAFGVVTAIAVNLVSDHATAALGVIVAGLAFGAVLLAADQLRRTPESSALRAYARPVAITLAAPLVLMSIIGAGGYLVFVAAAVVAVGLSGETDLRTALITVFALTGIAGSASALHRLGSLLLHPAGDRVDTWWLLYLAVRFLLTIGLAIVLLARGPRLLFNHMNHMLAVRFTVIGVIAVVGMLANIGEIRSLDDAADAVVGVVFAVSMLGCALIYFLPPERIDRLQVAWRELVRPRADGETHPPYREVLLRVPRTLRKVMDRASGVAGNP